MDYLQSQFSILREEHLAAGPFDLGTWVHVADSLHRSAAFDHKVTVVPCYTGAQHIVQLGQADQ